jgi:hypothetical protein
VCVCVRVCVCGSSVCVHLVFRLAMQIRMGRVAARRADRLHELLTNKLANVRTLSVSRVCCVCVCVCVCGSDVPPDRSSSAFDCDVHEHIRTASRPRHTHTYAHQHTQEIVQATVPAAERAAVLAVSGVFSCVLCSVRAVLLAA